MSLLVDISGQALDPGYALAAARRGTGQAPPRRPSLLAAAAVAAAFLVALAAVQAHRAAPAAARGRTLLVHQVQRAEDTAASLERQVRTLRTRTGRLRQVALAASAAGAALGRRVAAEEQAAGATPVAGPGLRVTLDDAAGGGNRVTDADVQAVVNALWAAGAEAVAVDGQRLTAQSAIRSAGAALLVNFQPLAPPYDVVAVGDPVALETSFTTGAAADRLRSLAQLYGLRFHVERATRLELPAAAPAPLQHAQPLPAAGAGP